MQRRNIWKLSWVINVNFYGELEARMTCWSLEIIVLMSCMLFFDVFVLNLSLRNNSNARHSEDRKLAALFLI